jgi:septal ring factor EnvC (AmiA/AmiB activator)
MKRRAALLVILVPALAAASVPIEPARETIGQALGRIAAETRAAEARVAALRQREDAANNEAERLRAERARAAADIAVTEARIAAADVRLTAARLAVANRSANLARRQAPLAALLAGLATMGRRPPVLALADGTSIEELVRVRALIDGSMPVIARRTTALRAELGEGRRLAERAEAARREVELARTDLIEKQQQFAALEARASARAAQVRVETAGADDQRLSGGEVLLDLGGEAAAAAEARKVARALAAVPLAPARPVPADARAPKPALDYVLPSAARVIDGLGMVNPSGVRSRGIRFASPRGSGVVTPAAGTILFAGPYREHDGIVVIDHGRGWTSLLVNVAPSVTRGDKVERGAPLGRALGDVGLELREAGQPRSAALIAGSSRLLSNRSKLR